MAFLKRKKKKEFTKVKYKEPAEEVEEPVVEVVEEPAEEIKEEVNEEEVEKEIEEEIDDDLIWKVIEVPTQTQRLIYNRETEKSFDLYSAVVEILNRTEE